MIINPVVFTNAFSKDIAGSSCIVKNDRDYPWSPVETEQIVTRADLAFTACWFILLTFLPCPFYFNNFKMRNFWLLAIKFKMTLKNSAKTKRNMLWLKALGLPVLLFTGNTYVN